MNNSIISSTDDLSLDGTTTPTPNNSMTTISPFLSGLTSRNNSKSSFAPQTPNTYTNTTIYHQVEIRPRDSFKFFVRAEEPLETLHFSFYTRKKSIGFGLFYLYLPNLCNESENVQVPEDATLNRSESLRVKDLPLEKVKELIGNSRENVRLNKIGQEGSLARALSTTTTAVNTKFLTVDGGLKSRSVSNENLSIYEQGGNLSETSLSPFQAQRKLKIGELIEIIPIKKFNSFEYTLQGSYTIPLTGTYVLLFDNSFSIGTSKHLFYHAYLSTDIVPNPSTTPQLLSSGQMGSLCAAGWLSKRRTGMVRNWSRRWFQLDSLGVLSYFEDRASPLRGSIFVPDCSLIIAKSSLRFSLDSGTQTFHLQAYRKDEFDFWIQVFSSFKHFGPPTTLTSSHQLPCKPEKSSNIKTKIDEAFKFARNRLDSLRIKQQSQQPEINEALGNLESLYDLLQKTREAMNEETENDLQANQESRQEENEEYEEIFYDVEEIYVDEIDDDRMTMGTFRSDELSSSSYSGTFNENYEDEDDEVFKQVIEDEDEEFLIEQKQKTGIPSPSISELNAERNRNITEWLLRADINLPRDNEMITNTSIYRNCLPFPAPPINISFASVIMRKSFPVALNEPINLLQRLAEELEYSELLDQAVELNNEPIEQMIKIAAFAVSGYASSLHRSERKPYNPVLGETYEYIRPDRGFRFIAEKVSHQPVIVACHAESIKWKFWQDIQAETKLWGKSMLINPKGKLHLDIIDEFTGSLKNSFTWNKVSGALRNVYSSKKSIENYGELVIRSKTSDLIARITFKESGMFSNSGNEVEGGIYGAKNGNLLAKLSGRWDDMICREFKCNTYSPKINSSNSNVYSNNSNVSVHNINNSNNNNNNNDYINNNNINNNNNKNLLQVIWKSNPLPSNYSQFFCLTSYGVTLNDLPELLKKVLPVTDSRYRPDQRMLESGMIDAADLEKQRIEQLQRNRRNCGDVVEPKWFTFDKASDSWKFNEKYWQERENGFKGVKMQKLW